jgi:hypothetical protein
LHIGINMTVFTFANNVNTTLAGAFSSSATSFTLASTAHLPTSIPAGEYLVVTLNDAATRGNYEVIYVGTISGATCSNLLRAQEGTAALSWLTGDYAYCAPTDGQMASFPQLGAANTWTGANTFADPVLVGAATASGDAVQLGQVTSIASPLQLATQAATSANEAVNLGQFPSSVGVNGYQEFPSGMIMQWGYVLSTGSVGTYPVTYPIPFPNQTFMVTISNAANTSPVNLYMAAANYQKTGFTAFVNNGTASWSFAWIAIGY